MKRVCSWCQVYLGETDTAGVSTQAITHTICEGCAAKFFTDNPQHTLKNLLDKFSIPIMVVGSNAEVRCANQSALSLFNKNSEKIINRLAGNVIECANARKPGGCGNSDSCSGCVIRSAIEKTHATGKNQENATAHKTINTPLGKKKVRLVVSTEKINNIVLLKLNEVTEDFSV